MWKEYVEGRSCGSLGFKYQKTAASIAYTIKKELRQLPDNTYISEKYEYKWSGIAIVDGTYISVKGYTKKIPFIYLMDYKTHDIVCSVLAPSETQEAFKQLFAKAYRVQYPLNFVVCDDIISSLEYSAKYSYPHVLIQLCTKHWKDNVKLFVKQNVKNEKLQEDILKDVSSILRTKTSKKEKVQQIKDFVSRHGPQNITVESIASGMLSNFKYLFLYCKYDIPNTTNLIEGTNNQIKSRVHSMKGFNSFENANLFLNAWMINRRLKPFRDCRSPFADLNGKTSLEVALKNQQDMKNIKNSVLGF